MPRSDRGLEDIGRDIAVSLVFMTRIPASRLGLDPAEATNLQRAVRVFPLAGALIGAIGALTLLLGNALGLPPLAAALLAISVLVIGTGALHEDGLADTADGFGGGRTLSARLAIMRDSRIGSYGALALILSILLKASLLAAFLPLTPLSGAFALIAAETIGRAAIVYHWAKQPAARPDGLAGSIGQPADDTLWMALVFALVIGLVAGTAAAGPIAALVALAVAALVTLGFGQAANRLIGGHTGDTLGAVEQLAVLGTLLALIAFA
ncbi:MAG TPA: adenosylcobinamide-GDP ribazoletransferase [Kaistia sp.]|nr:adenosylcobinamide-GDP ribazoletransferase [Kaistia sp.]